MRPLLILDCDEVILEFAQPFAAWLEAEHGLLLDFRSYDIAGNLSHIADGTPVEPDRLPALFDGFFGSGQALQQPVPGVLDALDSLSGSMDIAIVSNIPNIHHARRLEVLARHGVHFTLHCNEGGKGPKVAALARGKPGIFVDDLPPNHESVAAHAPDVRRLHMVADRNLRGLIPASRHAHARIDDWPAAADWITDQMERMR
jgi:hypothetical protein